MGLQKENEMRVPLGLDLMKKNKPVKIIKFLLIILTGLLSYSSSHVVTLARSDQYPGYDFTTTPGSSITIG